MSDEVEYRDRFSFQTHIETVKLPVAHSCRITCAKSECDVVCLEIESNCPPHVTVGISEDGIPCVKIGINYVDNFMFLLIDGKWQQQST